jgi:hypothetical protein
VSGARIGRETRYALEREALDDAAAWIATVGDEWDRHLGALRRTLDRRT